MTQEAISLAHDLAAAHEEHNAARTQGPSAKNSQAATSPYAV
jgi:hypothetical protein